MDTRIFVSKKEQFRVESDSLCNELKTSLSLDANLNLTLYNIYDIFNADETDIQLLKENVCSEVVTDTVFDAVDLKDKNIWLMNIYQDSMIKERIVLCSV